MKLLNDIEQSLRELSDFDVVIKIEVIGHEDHDLIINISVDDILWDEHIFSDVAFESLEKALSDFRKAIQEYVK